jgi:hypothetical protein
VPRYWSKRGKVYSTDERAGMITGFYAALAQRATDDMAAIVTEYKAATPIVSVSRCPFTGGVFETSLDILGVDGMWWAYDYDYRPYVAPIATFLAWTGSMQFDGPIPNLPLKSMVGPAAPFVLPRILHHDAVRAVMSTILIGEHVGFPVVYFAQPVPADLERVDDWGHAMHYLTRPDGSPSSAHSTEYDIDKDFEIEPWIRSGKLSWIAPGDIDLTLRTSPADCPFVTVGGERHRQYIQNGKTWMAQDRDFGAR